MFALSFSDVSSLLQMTCAWNVDLHVERLLFIVASCYLQSVYAVWASTAFWQGELVAAGGKLQRRTVARGSYGVDHTAGVCWKCFNVVFVLLCV